MGDITSKVSGRDVAMIAWNPLIYELKIHTFSYSVVRKSLNFYQRTKSFQSLATNYSSFQ